MAAIDEAFCQWCGVPASFPPGDCLDRPGYDGTNRPHVFVVPLSAIAAALDGLASGDGGTHDPWSSGYGAALANARRALLGEVPTEAKENET